MLKFVKNSTILSLFVVMMLVFAACGSNTATNNAAPSASASASASVPAATAPAESIELTISAAASLTDALTEIQTAYKAQYPAIKLSFNFGASGALEKQIEQGAPADLFLSAAVKNMKALVDQGLVDTNAQKNILKNELVVVVPTDSKLQIGKEADLSQADVKKVAIGIPESVPAGSYAKEALTKASLWDSLQPKLVQAKDVRQVLQYVESGNTDAGFVYKTDALTSEKTKIAFAVDPGMYTAIQYPIGIVKATKHAKEAEAFYNYLQTKEALDIFVKYGFTVAD